MSKLTKQIIINGLFSILAFNANAFDLDGFSIDTGNSNSNITIDTESIIKVIQTGKKVSTAFFENEKNVGRHASANLLGASPLLRSDSAQTYVNKVGRWVASHTDRADQEWHFAVINDHTINAFSAPGGYIFVTSGLLKQIDNESQLAGVLAHEVAHVVAEHHMSALQASTLKDIAIDIGASAMDNQMQVLAAEGLVNLWASGLPKEDEFEADNMGIVIATRAGYEPWGLYTVIQKLDALTGTDPNLGFMSRTHPLPEERLEKLNDPMDTLDKFSDNPQVSTRYRTHTAVVR